MVEICRHPVNLDNRDGTIRQSHEGPGGHEFCYHRCTLRFLLNVLHVSQCHNVYTYDRWNKASNVG